MVRIALYFCRTFFTVQDQAAHFETSPRIHAPYLQAALPILKSLRRFHVWHAHCRAEDDFFAYPAAFDPVFEHPNSVVEQTEAVYSR